MSNRPHRPKARKRPRPDLRWIVALSHPLRVEILDVLEVRTASPKELHELLDIPLSNSAYHSRILVKANLIEEVDRRQRRGATEHFYRSKPKSALGHQMWRAIPQALRGNVTAIGFEHFVRRLTDSLSAGLVDSNDETVLTSIPIAVDEIGWARVNEVLLAALSDIEEISDDSRERLGPDRAQGAIPLVVGLAAFQAAATPERKGQ